MLKILMVNTLTKSFLYFDEKQGVFPLLEKEDEVKVIHLIIHVNFALCLTLQNSFNKINASNNRNCVHKKFLVYPFPFLHSVIHSSILIQSSGIKIFYSN